MSEHKWPLNCTLYNVHCTACTVQSVLFRSSHGTVVHALNFNMLVTGLGFGYLFGLGLGLVVEVQYANLFK